MRIIGLLAGLYFVASASAQTAVPGAGSDPEPSHEPAGHSESAATADPQAGSATQRKYAVAKELSDKVQAFLARRDFAKALAAVDEALAAESDNAELYRLRASIHCRAANYKSCVDDASKAINTDKEYAPAYLLRALAHVDAGTPGDGRADCDVATRIWPDRPLGYNCRGLVDRALGNYPQALTDFDEAKRHDEKFALADYNKGFIYALLNKPDEAIASFTAAIAIDEAFADSYAQRGKLRLAKGDVDGGRTDFHKALSLNGRNFTAAVGMQALQVGKALDLLARKN